jgi:hypothetical protein
VAGACIDGYERGSARKLLFSLLCLVCSRSCGFACERCLFLLPGRFVPAGGVFFCFSGLTGHARLTMLFV